MRQGNHNKQRTRGRSRKNTNSATRTIESNGPDVKVRGNAQHIAEKYHQLARDAQAAGDRIIAENYLQHAEHYNRIVASANSNQQYGQSRFQPTQADSTAGAETDHASETREVVVEGKTDQIEAEVTIYSQDEVVDAEISENSTEESEDGKLCGISEDSDGTNDKAYKSQKRTVSSRSRGTPRSPVTRRRSSKTVRASASSS